MGEGVLSVEGVAASAIADAVGTPVYVYSAAAIRSQYQELDKALAPVPHRICYSVKANGNLAILNLLRSLGAGVDIVSGGEGSELYRVSLPDDYIGLSIDEVAARLRRDHRATLLSINRGGRAYVNPDSDFVLSMGDDAIVVAETLGELAPLEMSDLYAVPKTAAVVPSA